jgi:hypothetical protein
MLRKLPPPTSLPVNADFQNGYADTPTIWQPGCACIKTGVAGLSIEDATGNDASPLYETGLAIARIKAARSAIDKSGVPVVLTARCEAALVGHASPLEVALERLVAFSEQAWTSCTGLAEPTRSQQSLRRCPSAGERHDVGPIPCFRYSDLLGGCGAFRSAQHWRAWLGVDFSAPQTISRTGFVRRLLAAATMKELMTSLTGGVALQQ